jgi:ubiquinol-cytochrome c reductase cytochrome b subunit
MPVDRRPRGPSLTRRLSDQVRYRTPLGRRIARTATELHHRRVPKHWTNLFGVVSLACFAVLMITGVFLMFFYTPSSDLVTYRGSYPLLDGAEVSQAFQSTLTTSFDVPGGLLMRQAHHWAALLLPASLIMQLAVMFFTGGFRRPRRGSWVALFLIFVVTLIGGWSGYALPDDMLSGTGLRIVEGIALGIPVVGTWATFLLFGGGFPGEIIGHLYPIHVLIVPAALIALLAVRILLAYVNKPPQFAGPGRTEEKIVGERMLPNAAIKAGGLFGIVGGVLILIAATVTINPIWLYGPAAPGDASAGSQPDWYTGFLDGALRLVPPGWEIEVLGRTWTLAILVPLGAVTAYLLVMALYPFLEEWITADRGEHHILDRPRNMATRTAGGVAGIVFYGVLWGAGSADIVATHFNLALEGVVSFYQIALLAGPIISFMITRRVCLALQKKDRSIALHGYETGRIVRLPGGEYIEVHRPVTSFERWRLVSIESRKPFEPRPAEDGRLPFAQRARGALSRFFFEDRLDPVTPAELDRTNAP